MKPVTRTILFCRVLVDKKMHLYPVAVFGDETKAKGHAAFLHLAHKTGDVDTVKQLDPNARVTEDGALHPGAKFSVQTVPYEPAANLGIDDAVESDPPASS